ncbi:hypothetical protein PsYK624_162370 [Phanerochaete sordida]|uniref:RING-type domain-containing protein n=1 Tax=Phanerochaete sordida TaxID=48140 RepID=A0A9P3GSE8_9APHY|nr:hypothetical protein PsYK624_162370 [Phanerochaete sordida]
MNCPICLESLAPSPGPVVSTPCGHLFHESCLANVPESGGSEESRRCPTCRALYICRHESQNLRISGPKALRRVYLDSGEISTTVDDAQEEITLLRAQLERTRGLRQQDAEEAQKLKQRLSQTQDQLRNLKIKQDEVAALGGQLTDARERLRKAEKREQNAMQRTRVIGEALSEERKKKRASEQALREQMQKLQGEVKLLNKGAKTLFDALNHESAVSAGLRRKIARQEANVQEITRSRSPALGGSALTGQDRTGPDRTHAHQEFYISRTSSSNRYLILVSE